jgi:hypothetical protein
MHLICIKKLLNEIYELGNEEEYLIRKTCTHLGVSGFFVRIFFPFASYSFVILIKALSSSLKYINLANVSFETDGEFKFLIAWVKRGANLLVQF